MQRSAKTIWHKYRQSVVIHALNLRNVRRFSHWNSHWNSSEIAGLSSVKGLYSPGWGLTRGTGLTSEDHKSVDYKRHIGNLSFFRCKWRPFLKTFNELEHTKSSSNAFQILTVLSEKKCWRNSVLIRLFFNLNVCPTAHE